MADKGFPSTDSPDGLWWVSLLSFASTCSPIRSILALFLSPLYSTAPPSPPPPPSLPAAMPTSFSSSQKDLEKGASSSPADTEVLTADDGIQRTGKGPLGALWRAAKYLDSFGAPPLSARVLIDLSLTALSRPLGVEVRGVERVPEDERVGAHFMDSGYLWFVFFRFRSHDPRSRFALQVLCQLHHLDVLAWYSRLSHLVHGRNRRLLDDCLLQCVFLSFFSLSPPIPSLLAFLFLPVPLWTAPLSSASPSSLPALPSPFVLSLMSPPSQTSSPPSPSLSSRHGASRPVSVK